MINFRNALKNCHSRKVFMHTITCNSKKEKKEREMLHKIMHLLNFHREPEQPEF